MSIEEYFEIKSLVSLHSKMYAVYIDEGAEKDDEVFGMCPLVAWAHVHVFELHQRCEKGRYVMERVIGVVLDWSGRGTMLAEAEEHFFGYFSQTDDKLIVDELKRIHEKRRPKTDDEILSQHNKSYRL